MSETDDRWKATVQAPFKPTMVSGNGLDTDAMLRIATAVEYMAAQLGQINGHSSFGVDG